MDHSGHRQRLKRAYRENGLMSFSPHEVIELMLYTALPRRDVNELAHKISDQCGGVDGLMRMDRTQMAEKLHLSPRVIETLSAYGAAVRLYSSLSPMSARRLETRGDKNELIKQVYKPNSRVLVLLGAGREGELFTETRGYLTGFIVGAPASMGALILVPFMQMAGKNGLLAGAELRQGADNGDLGAAGADGQHGVAVFLIPENGSFDGRFKMFHLLSPASVSHQQVMRLAVTVS